MLLLACRKKLVEVCAVASISRSIDGTVTGAEALEAGASAGGCVAHALARALCVLFGTFLVLSDVHNVTILQSGQVRVDVADRTQIRAQQGQVPELRQELDVHSCVSFNVANVSVVAVAIKNAPHGHLHFADRKELLETMLELSNSAVPVDRQCHVLTEGKHERTVVRSTIQLLNFIDSRSLWVISFRAPSLCTIITFKIRRSESVRTSVEFLDVFIGVHLGAVGGLVEEEVPNDAAVVDVVLTVH
mmetsp:Transcript_28732/g.49303  ORF Transcript_28732/g.49303 Transcript_28732/m.49303 type:complete len:246 (-) Transcript_28732:25-762(-)